MSATTDTLLDKLNEVERQRDDYAVALTRATELLAELREAVELLDEHRTDLVFIGQLREQLDALGITPGQLTDKVAQLSGGPVGRLLGLGRGDAPERGGGSLVP